MGNKLYYEDPQIFKENKLNGHCTMSTFASIEAWRENQILCEKTLKGQWTFKLSEKVKDRPFNFYELDYNDSKWNKIQVPGSWQLQGYESFMDNYISGNKSIPKKKTNKAKDNSVGSYRRNIAIEEEQMDGIVHIEFGAVKSAFYLWVNGLYVGYSQGSMTPARFDISPMIQKGDNLIAVEVYSHSDGDCLENQDQINQSGLLRDVTIYFEPKLYIEDIYLRSDFDDSYKEATFKANVVLNNTQDIDIPVKVKCYIQELDSELTEVLVEGRVLAKNNKSTTSYHEVRINQPRLWSAEDPNLYEVIVVLTDHLDKVLQIKSLEYGFREIKVENDGLLINGKPLMIKGINRSEFDSEKGYVVSRELYEEDFKIMKRCHINSIRTSHYPSDPMFYALCNQYGFYVMDEVDVDGRGNVKKINIGKDREWKEALIDRGERLVHRDKNHPCVILWSLGNNAGYGKNFIDMKNAMKAIDQKRPFHYDGDRNLFVSDVFSRPNSNPNFVERIGKGLDIPLTFKEKIANLFGSNHEGYKALAYKRKPAILSAYGQSRNNGLGNMKGYMDLFKKYPRWHGGFIYSYSDLSLKHKAQEGDQWLYGDDFEGVTYGRQYGLNGIVAGDRTLHPSAYEVKQVYAPFEITFDEGTGDYSVKNLNLFTSTEDYELWVAILEDGELAVERVVKPFEIQPGELIVGRIEEWLTPKLNHVHYHMNFEIRLAKDTWWAEAGFVLMTEQFEKSEYELLNRKSKSKTPCTFTEDDKSIRIIGDVYQYEFSKKTGYLVQIIKNNIALLSGPLRPNFWRDPTDNDLSRMATNPKGFHRPSYQNWKNALLTSKVKSYEIGIIESLVRLDFKLIIKGFKGTFDIRYEICATGDIDVHYQGTPLSDMVKFGSTMTLMTLLDEVSWFGRGPHENYCDRKTSAPLGIYHTNLEDFGHSYVRPQENGNHTQVHWLSLMNPQGFGLIIESMTEKGLEVSSWPYTHEALEEASHRHQIDIPGTTTINIDYRQQGISGNDLGDYTLESWQKLSAMEHFSYGYRLIITDED